MKNRKIKVALLFPFFCLQKLSDVFFADCWVCAPLQSPPSVEKGTAENNQPIERERVHTGSSQRRKEIFPRLQPFNP